tara:strand:- start:923 stop:1162 length:240 start_codon:yes stop_codon:yes gene_type:complete
MSEVGYRLDAIEEDVRDLKQISSQITTAQARTDVHLSNLEGQLKIQNIVLEKGFNLIQRVMMAGIAIISVIVTGTQMVV